MGRRRGSKTGGFEPGTIAIAVLSAVTGVSGYGASVVNKDQKAMIDEKVAKEVAAIRGSVDELESIKSKLTTEISEKEKLNSEVINLKAAIERLKKEKDSKEGELKAVQVGELAFRSATSAQLKKTFEIVQKDLPDTPETAEVFKAVSTAMRRGTLSDIIARLVGPTGKSAEELRDLFVKALRQAPDDLQKDQSDVANKKKEETATRAEEIKKKKDEIKQNKKDAKRTKASLDAQRKLTGQLPIVPPDEELPSTENPIVKTRNPSVTTVATDPVELPPVGDLPSRSSSVTSDTFKPEEEERMSFGPMGTRRRGGMRKKKLRTRRGGKQNVRRSRNRENRANRTN